jgi:hypothetical protein
MKSYRRIDKQLGKIDLTPQTKRRIRVALADTYDDAVSMINAINTLPREELSIRRLRKGFGIYHRVFIKKEKKHGT